MLAEISDLAAIGAIRTNEATDDAMVERAHRLLELASDQVMTHTPYATEAALRAALTGFQVSSLTAIVVELAAERLNVSAAPSSEFYAGDPHQAPSIVLHGWQIERIRAIVGSAEYGSGGSFSVELERDEASSFFRPYNTLEGWA